MNYYLDKEGNIHEKSGMDFRISKGLHDGEGLTEVGQDYVDNMLASKSETYAKETEYNWAKSELEASDIEIKYHERGSAFATCTKAEWVSYQEALLHYVTEYTVDNETVYTINDISTLYDYIDEDTGRPLSPPQDTELNYLLDKAKKLRDDTISSDLLSQGMLFQVRDSVDLNNIQDAIDEAEYSSLPAEYTLDFRLADNTWATVTVDILKQVKSDYRTRKLATYTAFKTWTDGDMSEEFSL